MDFQVIVTLGPANMTEPVLRAIDSQGPCLYRINGAHSKKDEINGIVTFVRNILPHAKIMVDLPGNKIRTANIKQPIPLIKGQTFTLSSNQINYRDFYKHLKVGDQILANDSIYTLEVQQIQDSTLTVMSHSDGQLANNKGLHAKGIHKDIPFFFENDLDLIQAAHKSGVDILSLSFVRDVEDILLAKKILRELDNSKLEIFAKIETLSAVNNLGRILAEVDVVNVDRGDLSTDVGLVALAAYQERIINAAKRSGRKIFLATQFLKNMETYPVPLIAEIIDLHKTIKDGISGIQLSEETAIGKYPVEAVKTVFQVYYQSFSS